MRDGEATRVRLDRTAVGLFAKRGVEATSVRDIAKAAGVAEGTLYRHYVSKEALARAVFKRQYEALGRAMLDAAANAQGLRAKLAATIGEAYRLFDADPAMFGFLLLTQHEHLDAVETEFSPVDLVQGLIADGMAAGEVPRGDPAFAAALVMGLALQPATFAVYGRLGGPLVPRGAAVASAALRALGARSCARA